MPPHPDAGRADAAAPPAASPWPNPLAGNPLRGRADVARMLQALLAPLPRLMSPGGARLRLGTAGAVFDDVAAELEGYARPLWGLAPFAAGGGAFAHWDPWRRGLLAGTDPAHPESWGRAADHDQRIVEMAALGFALALAPDALLGGADAEQRGRVAAWLRQAERLRPVDNNWWFFRVVVGLGLRLGLGEAPDAAAQAEALDRLDAFHLGGGWYRDGPTNQLDHYVAFAFHFYGLVYARLARETDRARAARFRGRARAFAPDFRRWFGADGAALPFGRSLTYRFAQGAFWGALAFAGEEALPWGEVKGLYLRHLRWWAARPMLDRDGVLSLGYAYASGLHGEEYNGAGSPYWALKAFLPLALPEDHPFWAAEEAPDAPPEPPVAAQPHPGLLLFRAGRRQVVALASGQDSRRHRQAPAKYAKMAYSTVFGFSVESDSRGLERGCFDGTLALSDDGGATWRQRAACEAAEIRRREGDGGAAPLLWSLWRPWPDVEIETLLVPAPPWHLRVHRVRARRPLEAAEGGFAVDRTGDGPAFPPVRAEAARGVALARAPAGLSGLRDLDGRREGFVVRALPNTNLVAARTLIPTLRCALPRGTAVLRCAVLALPAEEDGAAAWEGGPPPFAGVHWPPGRLARRLPGRLTGRLRGWRRAL